MKRYDLEWIGHSCSPIREMKESPDGDWVDYEDVEKLIEAARAVVEAGAEVDEWHEATRDKYRGQNPTYAQRARARDLAIKKLREVLG